MNDNEPEIENVEDFKILKNSNFKANNPLHEMTERWIWIVSVVDCRFGQVES